MLRSLRNEAVEFALVHGKCKMVKEAVLTINHTNEGSADLICREIALNLIYIG